MSKRGAIRMNETKLRRELFLLVGYLLSSAHGLYDEPLGYGPFRLLDTAGRLLEIMRAHGLGDPFLERLERSIADERAGSSDDDQLRRAIDDLVAEYAAELGQRLPAREAVA